MTLSRVEDPLFDRYGMPIIQEPNSLNGTIGESEKSSLFHDFIPIVPNEDLDRKLVSFQGNKQQGFHNWVKYKEGFSEKLVSYFIENSKFETGTIFDPFSGSGTTLLTSIKNKFSFIGFEILPPAILMAKAKIAASKVKINELNETYKNFVIKRNEINPGQDDWFTHINITKGAFSLENEKQIAVFKNYIRESYLDDDIRTLLLVAGMSVLEGSSFTKKDGQYLRWDSKSGKTKTNRIIKDEILSFLSSLDKKINQIIKDISLNSYNIYDNRKSYSLIEDSCLTGIISIPNDSVDLTITSPPYCNRYDYTRTYALEIAFLGTNEINIKKLRQQLLSATVESKSKIIDLKNYYSSRGFYDYFEKSFYLYSTNRRINEYIEFLEIQKNMNLLNNKNILGMIQNYLFESILLIGQISRITSKGGMVYIVNDNVQYNGKELELDLIFSEIAHDFGLHIDKIWTLPKGKGNSSQQMKIYGRKELRKCVYVWRKI